MILFSHSGVNAVILDMALGAKVLGMKLIAVTSFPHSSAIRPRATPRARNSYEVSDVVIDTGAPLGDSGLSIEGVEAPVGAIRPASDRHRARDRRDNGREAGGARRSADGDGQSQHRRQGEGQRVNDRNYEELWRRLKA